MKNKPHPNKKGGVFYYLFLYSINEVGCSL